MEDRDEEYANLAEHQIIGLVDEVNILKANLGGTPDRLELKLHVLKRVDSGPLSERKYLSKLKVLKPKPFNGI